MSDDSSSDTSLSPHDLNNYLSVFSFYIIVLNNAHSYPVHFSLALDGDATDRPVDIDAIVAALEVDDACAQDDVLRTIFQSSIIPEGERDPYESLPFHSLRLSRLKEMFVKKQASQAINYLNLRCKIKIDDDMQFRSNHPSLFWDLREHRLDFLLTVSASIGLWAATPNVNVDHNYNFALDLKKPYRDFKGKYGKLGFDPKGRILFIGKSRNDDVWLAMAPWSFFDDSTDNMPAGHVTGDTRLSAKHYRMLVMFFAHLLSQLPDRGFTCIDKYGVHLSDPDPLFFVFTNIMYVLFSFLLHFVHSPHSCFLLSTFPSWWWHSLHCSLPHVSTSSLRLCSFFFPGNMMYKHTYAYVTSRLLMTRWSSSGWIGSTIPLLSGRATVFSQTMLRSR